MANLVPFNGRVQTGETHTLLPADGGVPLAVEEVGLDVGQIVAVLRRYAWLVVGTILLAATAAFLLTSHQKVIFRAGAVIRLQDDKRALTGGIGDPGGAPQLGYSDPVLSVLQVLQTRGVASEVVRRTGYRLQATDELFRRELLGDIFVADSAAADTVRVEYGASSYRASIGKTSADASYGAPVHLPGVTFTISANPGMQRNTFTVIPLAQAIDQVRSGLHAQTRERTDVVDVSFESPDPELAKQVVNAGVEAFSEFDLRTAVEQSRRRREFVAAQLRSADSALRQTQQAVGQFQRQNKVLSARDKFAAAQSALINVDSRLAELRAERDLYASLLARLTKPGSAADRSTLDAVLASSGASSNPVIAALYTQLSHLEEARDTMTAGKWGRSPSGPDVQRLDQLITSAEAKLIEGVRGQVASLDARMKSLADLRNRNAAELEALPQSESEEMLLTQRLQADQSIADLLRTEYQKARIAEAGQIGHVNVLDLATTSVAIGRGRLGKVLLAIFLGLFLGGGVALLLDRLNTAVRTRDEVEHVLQAPGLAVIPQIAARNGAVRRLLPTGARLNGTPILTSDGQAVGTGMSSAAAEAFRTLRTNILFSQSAGKLQRIVVTSAAPTEGKTTVVVNLGAAFATQGMRVLLVDCDMRRPRLHSLFHVPREPGLTQLLLGQAKADEVIHPTPVPGLSVLTVGTLPASPSELLGSERMKNTLDELTGHYDLVVIDSPPLVAASDAAILGSHSDGVLMVIRAGRTDRALVQQARKQLAAVHARIIGAVLNDADDQLTRYDAYYEYYYQYYGNYAETEPRPV